ncbi:MAG: SOS response-associated peptidase [Bacteroidales bacterium]|nr:SOS response-associated peptidase [Bacteroidales bacterium]
MCFFTQITKTAQELSQRFKADFIDADNFQPAFYNGFQFPKTPIITNKKNSSIQLFHWGLIPHWAKDDSIKSLTLNAKIETIHEKPAFRNVTHQRCLVLVDGFFEWKWLDEKGKQKQKYRIGLADNHLFALAGLYSTWQHPQTGLTIDTYTILTTQANALMSEIHNTKKRMPVVLLPEMEQNWLLGKTDEISEIQLCAEPIF